jgi:hypothetical protein
MLRPTEHPGHVYPYGEAGYYVPMDQDLWLDAFGRAAATATQQGGLIARVRLSLVSSTITITGALPTAAVW